MLWFLFFLSLRLFDRPLPEVVTCETAPRWYCAPSGSPCWQEIDTYQRRGRCPATPIK